MMRIWVFLKRCKLSVANTQQKKKSEQVKAPHIHELYKTDTTAKYRPPTQITKASSK